MSVTVLEVSKQQPFGEKMVRSDAVPWVVESWVKQPIDLGSNSGDSKNFSFPWNPEKNFSSKDQMKGMQISNYGVSLGDSYHQLP